MGSGRATNAWPMQAQTGFGRGRDDEGVEEFDDDIHEGRDVNVIDDVIVDVDDDDDGNEVNDDVHRDVNVNINNTLPH